MRRLMDVYLPDGDACGAAMLFIHGSGDETVSHTKSIDLCRQINDAGGSAR